MKYGEVSVEDRGIQVPVPAEGVARRGKVR